MTTATTLHRATLATHTIRRAVINYASLGKPLPPPRQPQGVAKFRVSGKIPLTSISDTAFDLAIADAIDTCERAHEGTGLKPALAYFYSKKDGLLSFNASSFEMPKVFTRSRKEMCPTLFDLRMSEGAQLAHVLVEIRTTEPKNGRPGGLFLELRGLMLSH